MGNDGSYAATPARGSSVGWATLAIVAAAAMFGTLPFFARTLSADGMAPPAVALFRFAVTAIILLPCLRLAWASLWGFGGGMVMGLGWIGFVEAVKVMSVAEAGVLFMTYPFFAIAIAVLVFRERLSARGLAAAALILIAAALVAPLQSTDRGATGAALRVAVLFGLAAPAAYGLLINILVRKVSALPPLSAVAAIALGATMGVAPLVAALPAQHMLPATGYGFAMLAVFSLVTAMVPQITMAVFAPKVGATRTALAGGAELPTMLMVGAVAFGEPVTLLHGVASVLIITAIALAPAAPPSATDSESLTGPAPRPR